MCRVCVSVCRGRSVSVLPLQGSVSFRADESEHAAWGGAWGRAGRKGLPPRPGQLDFSQPSDSDPLSSQAARQAGK